MLERCLWMKSLCVLTISAIKYGNHSRYIAILASLNVKPIKWTGEQQENQCDIQWIIFYCKYMTVAIRETDSVADAVGSPSIFLGVFSSIIFFFFVCVERYGIWSKLYELIWWWTKLVAKIHNTTPNWRTNDMHPIDFYIYKAILLVFSRIAYEINVIFLNFFHHISCKIRWFIEIRTRFVVQLEMINCESIKSASYLWNNQFPGSTVFSHIFFRFVLPLNTNEWIHSTIAYSRTIIAPYCLNTFEKRSIDEMTLSDYDTKETND